MSALLAKAALFECLERPKKAVGDFCLFFKAVVCLDRFMLLIVQEYALRLEVLFG